MAHDPSVNALLVRHVPVLRYDSQEPYFADAAAEWTDNPGNELRRADGTVLARAGTAPGALSLALLGPRTYATGQTVRDDDRIADPAHDYPEQAAALHARPAYANRVYGHCATGADGRRWLEYWFFYFYNDFNLIGPLIHAGDHEGDWEMIQLRLDPGGATPDVAVYAQHTHAQERAWSDVERVGSQPVVYPARGSHASYFAAGTHWTGDWFDHADGRRGAPPLMLHVLGDADAWATWPGFWGGTERAAHDPNPLNDSSPRGPGGHHQYTDPEWLLTTARDHAAARAPAPTAPVAPEASAVADGRDLHVSYDSGDADPVGLVVSTGAPGRPATVRRVPVSARAGTVLVAGAAPRHDEAVHVSIAHADGRATPAREITPQHRGHGDR